jgi:exodeoxyribonuclease III
VPNSGQRSALGDRLPKRIDYRARSWDPHFQSLCTSLSQKKPLIILGDMNVAHQAIDINNPDKHKQMAGFTDIERYHFELLLKSANLVDVWREKHPTKVQYTYFDYRTRARSRNAGWRLDYILISKELVSKVRRCEILSDINGSDHVPVELIMSLDLKGKNN